MGTKVAPTYATLTMGFLEEKLYKTISEQFGPEFSNNFRDSWKRYLDDCFVMWTKSKEELDQLHQILNNLNGHINFTIEFNKTVIPFLDCKIIKNGTEIQTDIFYKPTDSKSYLLFSSCHPKHTKVSIPFALARRLRTIISKQETLNLRLSDLKKFLLRQNYPLSLINAGIEKA